MLRAVVGPRERRPAAITKSDILVINKTDLARRMSVRRLECHERDANLMRQQRPFVPAVRAVGIEAIADLGG
jgi:Ni2+-binding GTPase involved in maturation of urease and hydrogenase